MANHDSDISRSEVMYPAAMANGGLSQSMIPAPPLAMPVAPVPGGVLPRGPEILSGSFDLTWLLNCLRRKWLMALLMGALAAFVAGVALLFLFPVSSSVTAYLELKAKQPSTLTGKSTYGAMAAKEFELFQQSQLTLFRSQFVLKAALARGPIAELPAVVKEGEDALTWLTESLRVSFPNKGEILEIRYDGDESASDMIKVVDAVIDAYRQEVLVKDKIRYSGTRDTLRDLRAQTAKELEDKIDRYRTLSKELGGGDTPLAGAMITMLRTDIHSIQAQIQQAKGDLIDLEVDKTVAIQQARSPSALQQAVEAELAQDPLIGNFRDEKYAMAQQIRHMQATTRGGTSKQIKGMQAQYQRLEQEEAQYKRTAEAEIRERLKSAPNEQLSSMMTEYVLRRDNLNNHIAELQAKHDAKMEELLQHGETSGSVDLLKSEIEQLQEVLREMDFKLRSEDVEEETALERVRVMQPAQAREKINRFERFAIAILGGIAAFCATCYGVALIEFRRRRLNGPADVDEGLGIRVLGALPSVSSRKAMAQGGAIAAQLSESI
ncbi:MAG: hypothetical protein KDA57_00595, partial [Planctomycetales bacterium]|nr:hypothetical protein [Planctomycetales bacterium]